MEGEFEHSENRAPQGHQLQIGIHGRWATDSQGRRGRGVVERQGRGMLLREAGGRDAREAAAVGPPTLLPAATAALPMLASLLPWLDEREMGDFF